MLRQLSPLVLIFVIGGAALVCGAICVVLSLVPGEPAKGPSLTPQIIVTAQSGPIQLGTETPEQLDR